MGFLLNLVLTCLLLCGSVHFGGNFLIGKLWSEWLGVPVTVGHIHWGLSDHKWMAENIRIKNSAGVDSAKIKFVEVVYDLSECRSGLVKISQAEAVIEEIRIERADAAGEIDLMKLNPVLKESGKVAPSRDLPLWFQISRYKLTVNQIVSEEKGQSTLRLNEPLKVEVNGLTTPDNIAVDIVILALRQAGWPLFTPQKQDAAMPAAAPLLKWLEKIQPQAQALQAGANQIIEKLSENKSA